MTFLVVAQEVEDYDKWRSVFDGHEGLRREHNLSNERVYQDVSNPNMITVVAEGEVSDLQAFAASDSLKEAMAEAGVVGAPMVSYSNDIT